MIRCVCGRVLEPGGAETSTSTPCRCDPRGRGTRHARFVASERLKNVVAELIHAAATEAKMQGKHAAARELLDFEIEVSEGGVLLP